MPKDDSPPTYEDAVAQPKDANLPESMQRDGPLPPPPSYTPGPHISWGQTGDYPPPGMWMGPGFGPSGAIPTLSGGVPSSASGEIDDFLSNQFESTSVRHAFIRKVYLILSVQLSITFSVVAVFTFVEPVKQFVINYPAVYYASLYYETKAVFIAMVDFTSCGGLLCISAVLLTILGIVTAVVLTFQYIHWLHMLYAAIGAIVYTLFLVYNTQLLIGNREHAISPEEYVYGALSLYIDVVNIFLFILQISGAATD
uniref:Uncharacterized protein n=1 Tax=Knipowitschia caucasica TaxID=637954 RepID=A0AAV2K5R2_KNICA